MICHLLLTDSLNWTPDPKQGKIQGLCCKRGNLSSSPCQSVIWQQLQEHVLFERAVSLSYINKPCHTCPHWHSLPSGQETCSGVWWTGVSPLEGALLHPSQTGILQYISSNGAAALALVTWQDAWALWHSLSGKSAFCPVKLCKCTAVSTTQDWAETVWMMTSQFLQYLQF